jgi:SAM-dependent methyltransferase
VIFLFANETFGAKFLDTAVKLAKAGIPLTVVFSAPFDSTSVRIQHTVTRMISARALSQHFSMPILVEIDVNSSSFQDRIRPGDHGIVAGFNQIFDAGTIGLFSTMVNFHPSLLPYYRGPVPSYWCIQNGERYSGFSLHEITPKIDAGRILAQRVVTVNDGDDESLLDFRIGEDAIGTFKAWISHLVIGTPFEKADVTADEYYRVREGYRSFPELKESGISATAVDWDRLSLLRGPHRAVLDMNDTIGGKNALIDEIQWQALRKKLPKTGRLLDIGCGTGRFASRISARGLDYTGADTSKGMIDAATAANKVNNCKFIHYDGVRTPFKENQFDVVMTVGVFQYIVGGEVQSIFVDELARLVRGSGKLLMIEQASAIGGRSGTVVKSTGVEEYRTALSSRFNISKIMPIRSSRLSAACLAVMLTVENNSSLKHIVSPRLAALETRKLRIGGEKLLQSVPYFDILIEATRL